MEAQRKKKRKSPRAWTDQEMTILAEQWGNGQPIRVWMDLLPRRTERAINMMGLVTHGPRGNIRQSGASISWRLICRVLAGGERLSPDEISARAGVSRRHVYSELKQHRGVAVHVAGYGPQPASGYRPKLWALGPGEDAPAPRAMTGAERARRRWRKLKKERPDYLAARNAKARFRDQERKGKFIRCDPAAAWMHGAVS